MKQSEKLAIRSPRKEQLIDKPDWTAPRIQLAASAAMRTSRGVVWSRYS